VIALSPARRSPVISKAASTGFSGLNSATVALRDAPISHPEELKTQKLAARDRPYN
jgi:hypothetical protein